VIDLMGVSGSSSNCLTHTHTHTHTHSVVDNFMFQQSFLSAMNSIIGGTNPPPTCTAIHQTANPPIQLFNRNSFLFHSINVTNFYFIILKTKVSIRDTR
jgi:hypothetical protein